MALKWTPFALRERKSLMRLVVAASAAAASGSEMEEGGGGESGMEKSGTVGRVRSCRRCRSVESGERGAEAGVVAAVDAEWGPGGMTVGCWSEGPGAGLAVRGGSRSSARGCGMAAFDVGMVGWRRGSPGDAISQSRRFFARLWYDSVLTVDSRLQRSRIVPLGPRYLGFQCCE